MSTAIDHTGSNFWRLWLGVTALKKSLFFSLLFVIIVLSVIPHTSRFVSPYKSPWMASGYIQHALGYFLLSAVACHAFPKRRTWACLAGILCLGIALELIQYIIPTRTFNLYDILANALGIFPVMIKKIFKLRR